MTLFVIQNFEALKKCVLADAGLKSITPGDCKTLSKLISKKTNQQVSETTLKRIFGFAYSKFNPSSFTLDAMSKYCGFLGWEDFCNQNISKSESTHNNLAWTNIKHNADKISGFTLQVLINKCVIPYNLTVKRQFINTHFNNFLYGDYRATIISGPVGYGKTIALCHWIEEQFLINRDIILFFSSNALINVFLSGKDINDWLLSLLGYGSEDDLSTLLETIKTENRNFYLIIDGLDEHMFRKEQFHLLLNQIFDIFSFYKYHHNFKLILCMRSSTWINYKHEFEDFEDEWFFGHTPTDDPTINVPLFNAAEIKQLSSNINPAAVNEINLEIAENFSHPLYFQFYYKLHRENFSLGDVDHVSIYELVSTFILNKVYLGNYSSEKAILNKAITENIDFNTEPPEVNKLNVNDLIEKYHSAYNELLGVGFLKELNKSGDLRFNTVIQFGNNNFLDFCLARLLLVTNKNVFDVNLINNLNERFTGNRKLKLLKWCIMYAIKNHQEKSFELLPLIHLTVKEKSEMIIFLGDVFKNENSSLRKNESIEKYFQNGETDELFNYFFGLELINTDYKKTLKTLLLFELSNDKKILIHTSLAVIAIIQLNVTELEENLSRLKDFATDDLEKLTVNPVNCLDTIYYYLKYGIVKKEAFAELTRFYFNPPTNKDISANSSINDILYLLGVYTLSICTNPYKIIRFINTIKKVYKKDECILRSFYFLVRIMRAEANFSINKKNEGLSIYRELEALHSKYKQSYTPFMLASFYLLKVKVLLYQRDGNEVKESVSTLFKLVDENDFKLLKAQALAFLFKNQYFLANDPCYENLHVDFLKIIGDNGLKHESLINSAPLLS